MSEINDASWQGKAEKAEAELATALAACHDLHIEIARLKSMCCSAHIEKANAFRNQCAWCRVDRLTRIIEDMRTSHNAEIQSYQQRVKEIKEIGSVIKQAGDRIEKVGVIAFLNGED